MLNILSRFAVFIYFLAVQSFLVCVDLVPAYRDTTPKIKRSKNPNITLRTYIGHDCREFMIKETGIVSTRLFGIKRT